MLPSVSDSTIAFGPSVLIAARVGISVSGAGFAWQVAQCCANNASPSGAWASALAASNGEASTATRP